MLQVTKLAGLLQTLFTTTADQLARLTHFVKRQGKITGANFAQTLVFEWMRDPRATVETLARKLDLSQQGLDSRFTPQARLLLQQLLQHALQAALAARRQPQGLLDRFAAVILEDTTSIKLPEELAPLFPGTDGSTKTAALKIDLRWNLRTGAILSLTAAVGKASDSQLAADPGGLPRKCLYLADLGFFSLQHRRRFASGQYWISRVAAGTKVKVANAWLEWPQWLRSVGESLIDEPRELGQTDPLPVRLIARRCPAAVAAERRRRCHARAKKACRGKASRLQLAACDWQVWATNVPASLLSANEVDTVYRCRWQVELFFKRAKSLGGWQIDPRNREDRVLVELWSKLLGVVVAHWLVLVRGGLLGGASLWKRMKVVQEYAGRLRESVSNKKRLTGLVERLKNELERVPKQRRSRRKPLTFQTLQTPATSNAKG
jgi:hypothetical protein